MKTLKRMFTVAVLAATTMHACAEVTWDAVKKKIADGKSYTTEYKYEGTKGKLKFDYRAVVPDHIRAEIKESNDSARVGAVLVYDSAWKQVRVKQGGGIIPRSLTHPDVAGTAFLTPVFSLVLEQIGGAKPTTTAEGDKTRFEFKTGSGKFTVWANAAADITKTERVDSTSREKEIRDFSSIKWNNNPDTGF